MVDKNKMSKGVLFGVLGVSCLVIIIVALAAWLYFNAPKKVKKEQKPRVRRTTGKELDLKK